VNVPGGHFVGNAFEPGHYEPIGHLTASHLTSSK